jgi:hypothetical protein
MYWLVASAPTTTHPKRGFAFLLDAPEMFVREVAIFCVAVAGAGAAHADPYGPHDRVWRDALRGAAQPLPRLNGADGHRAR